MVEEQYFRMCINRQQSSSRTQIFSRDEEVPLQQVGNRQDAPRAFACFHIRAPSGSSTQRMDRQIQQLKDW